MFYLTDEKIKKFKKEIKAYLEEYLKCFFIELMTISLSFATLKRTTFWMTPLEFFYCFIFL